MLDICKFFLRHHLSAILLLLRLPTPMQHQDHVLTLIISRYALAADIQTIPGLPTAPGYLNVDIDTETGEIDGLF